jgi:hypothetical protein
MKAHMDHTVGVVDDLCLLYFLLLCPLLLPWWVVSTLQHGTFKGLRMTWRGIKAVFTGLLQLLTAPVAKCRGFFTTTKGGKTGRKAFEVRRKQSANRRLARIWGTSWRHCGSGPCKYEDEDGWWVANWTCLLVGGMGASVRGTVKAWSSCKLYPASSRFRLAKYERRRGKKGRKDNKKDCKEGCQTTAFDDEADTRQPATGRGHRYLDACYSAHGVVGRPIYGPFRHLGVESYAGVEVGARSSPKSADGVMSDVLGIYR